MPRYCCRVVGVRVGDEITRSIVPAFAANLPLIVYLAAARVWIPVETRLSVILMFVGAIAIWGVGAWLLGLGSDERAQILGLVPTRKRGGGAA